MNKWKNEWSSYLGEDFEFELLNSIMSVYRKCLKSWKWILFRKWEEGYHISLIKYKCIAGNIINLCRSVLDPDMEIGVQYLKYWICILKPEVYYSTESLMSKAL